MQGIKIATDLHPGNNNIIIFLEVTRLGISLITRRTWAWLSHSRDLAGEGHISSSRALPRGRNLQCWRWRTGNGIHWWSAAQPRMSQEPPRRGSRRARPHRSTGKEQQLQAELNQTDPRPWCGWRVQLRLVPGIIRPIRYFQRWSLRLWKAPRTVQFTMHEKLQK